MFSTFGRPILVRRLPKTARLTSKPLSTTQGAKQRPFYRSKSFRAAVAGLITGIPAGFLAQDFVAPSTPHHHDFYQGSVEWKGKAVKPFDLSDVAAWLRKEQSSREGPSSSGIKSWDIVRCPSNAICEDNLVTAQCVVSSSQERPWLFWGIFEGHA
jgi:hypothetical protein